MKFLFLTAVSLLMAVPAMADQTHIYATCVGTSTSDSSKRVHVVVYSGDSLPTDAVVVVSETGEARHSYPVSTVGGGDVSIIYAGKANGGIKITIRDQGPGFLWLGSSRETFGLSCDVPGNPG